MRLFLFLWFIIIPISNYAQEYNWQETIFGQPNDGFSVGNKFVIDEDGNKVIVGQFKNSFSLLGETVYSTLPVGVFLAKVNQNDSLVWLETIAEAEEVSYPAGVYVLSPKHILDVNKNNEINIGLTFIDSTYITGVGYVNDQYADDFTWSSILLSYSSNGSLNDYNLLTGSCEKKILDFISIHDYKSIVIRNDVPDVNNPDTCFYNFMNSNFTDSSYGSYHMVNIFKFDSTDNLISHNSISNSGLNKIEQFNNTTYITGISNTIFASNVFDSTHILNYNPNIENRAFLAKYDSTSTIEWVRYFGNNGWDSHISMKDIIQSGNDIVIAGKSFTQSVSNQIFSPNSPTLNGSPWGGDDFFVVCYDTFGNVKWQSISNSPDGWEHITEITTDSNKNIYATGTFAAPLFFAGDTLIPFGSEDVFVLCYDSLGTEKWAINAAGTSLDQARSIGMAPNGDLYVSGSTFSSSATFGDITYSLSGNNAHLFLARLDTSSDSLSVADISVTEEIIQLYPNPNTGSFVINSKKESVENINIYNMLGDIVYRKDVNANQIRIDILNLPQGVFIAELKLSNGKTVQNKFILNR